MADLPDGIVLADTVTRLDARHAGRVLVTGSHGGMIAARYAASAGVRAVVFNDAGRGLDDAGVAGMHALASIGMAAAAVSHLTARIADARDAWESGTISDANGVARGFGVVAGMSCREAAARLAASPMPQQGFPPMVEARFTWIPRGPDGPAVVGVDSIGLVEPLDALAILVVGSHGALHGGVAASALPVRSVAAFFHDAGRGKDDVGVSRLPVLDAWGVPAATIDGASARIGDACSMWAGGRLSCVNRAMWAAGVTAPMSLQEAVQCLRARR
jgi:hypothetical protein